MSQLLLALKALIPILEPIGEQGINQLFASVVDPFIAELSDSSDLKLVAQCLSPGLKAFFIAEIQKLK